ncbi:hypothetical protein JOB18_001557 [Solea senegalensis]|uniref:Sushi domain-containing protein n=1 Tax=Solea senegalensis TaxID=28829 RepID=A0AAV6Q930_SOLSE|nr:beta-2-glycoprotein 1-like [Solea senegalensis]KAG7485028.1 hypothetical protein JOB18_001557 [Solea senegalensis]
MDFMLMSFLLCPFFITITSGQDTVCSRPELGANIAVDGLQKYFNPGAMLALSCEQGHTAVLGPRTIVCTASGHWTKSRLMCIPKLCPPPDHLANGEVYYENTVYQSLINYTCHEGYILTGAVSGVCQANGTWSTRVPECKPVSCGLAPIPQFGMIIYDKTIRGNTTQYGITGTYKCLPPYAVVGSARAECTASGTWTETPKCQVVTCPPPGNIDNGYKSSDIQRQYDYMEAVKYGCHGDYVLEGSLQIVCEKNGNWSEMPSCKRPCSVGIQRGRILYRGEKVWIENLKPKKVLHKEIVSLYCKDQFRNCGHAVTTQCVDGTLIIPGCFEEPSSVSYTLHSHELPSEIEPC